LTVELELVQGEDKVTDTLVITYEDPKGRAKDKSMARTA
jgi:hypothetical protein